MVNSSLMRTYVIRVSDFKRFYHKDNGGPLGPPNCVS